MKINNSTIPVWQDFALQDSNISKIVFPSLVARIARQDSLLPVEISGYYIGVLFENVFYIVSTNSLCLGKAKAINKPEVRQVGLHPERKHCWLFEEEVSRLFSQKTKNARTILWHTHPKTDESALNSMFTGDADIFLSILREELEEGLFDHLGKDGLRPTLDEVINEELSKKLSPTDINLTPGCAHILITDTAKAGHPDSWINAYRLDKESGQEDHICVELLGKQSRSMKRWYKEIMEKYWEAFKEASVRHNKILESLTETENLLPWKIPEETFFIKA